MILAQPADYHLIEADRLKDEIRQRTDVVDLISEHVALKQRGRDFGGLCPFHQEKTPSFYVSPAKQIFKCFGCGAGGDVFTFVQLREGVSFPEAIRILADRAGIDYDRQVGRAPAEGPGRADLARVNEWAMTAFQQALQNTPLGDAARAYLAERQIPLEMQQAFKIGFAPDDFQWLLAQGQQAGFRPQVLHAAGLTGVSERGSAYSVFRGRLMFPIRDTMNRVIGFGGRTLTGDRAKYLNTAQNGLFDKGRNLYGLDLARQAMLESRQAVVVEGYTDCIACHQHGISNAVATLGTALTDQHVNLLRRWSDEIVLVFDADAAGVGAADRAVSVALRYNVKVRIARVTSGKDPYDFLQTHGASEFSDLLNSAEDALVFKWNRTRERFAADGGADRKQAVEEFISLVGQMVRFGTVDAIQQGLIANELSRLLAVPAAQVRQLLTDAGAKAAQAANRGDYQDIAGEAGATQTSAEGPQLRAPSARPRGDAEHSALVTLLQILLNEPGHFADVADVFRPERIADDAIRRVAQAVVALCEQLGDFRLGELLGRFEDPADAGLVTELALRGERVGNYAATIADTCARLRTMENYRQVRSAAAGLRVTDAGHDGLSDDERLQRIQRGLAGARGFAPGIPASVQGEDRPAQQPSGTR